MNNTLNFCGFVAIIGKSNVGKSTLLNQFLKQKISIISSKPQTTLNCIMGVKTNDIYQIAYIDTPGVEKKNNFFSKEVNNWIIDCDLIIFLLNGIFWNKNDEIILKKIIKIKKPIILAINKIDNIKDKKLLLPHINFLNKKAKFVKIVPISAKNNQNLDIIYNTICSNIPKKTHIFSKTFITNNSKYFMLSEIIREQLMCNLNEELPYSAKVKIQKFQIHNYSSYLINAIIFVKRIGHKKIIIGSKGSTIKIIGIKARKNIEIFLKKKVHLKLWVKINCNLF